MANKKVKGIFWGILERASSQLITFVVGIVLARLLTPEDYGTIGLLTIFIMISNVFVESGFGNALVRKLDCSEADCSTAFFFNVGIGIIIYIILFCIAPFVAAFFDTPVLIPLLRIIGLNIIFYSFTIVQRALLTAQLNIKYQTKVTLFSQIPSGILAIYLAYAGLGVYSLAFQQVATNLIAALLFWIGTKWRPKFIFDINSFKYLWPFGSKIVFSSLIGVIYNQAYSFIIGKFFTKTQLGFYSKSYSLASQPTTVVNGVVQKVVLPIFSEYQNDRAQLLSEYRKYISVIFLVFVPLTIILVIIAKPLILILWGEKWLPCVWIFSWMIIAYTFEPLTSLNLCLLQALGRTDFMLKLEFIKKPLYAIIIAICLLWGLKGIVAAMVINCILGNIINMSPTRFLLQYNYREQFHDILKYVIIGLLSSAPVFILFLLCVQPNIFEMLACVLFAMSIYTLILYKTKDTSFKLLTAQIIHIYKSVKSSKKCTAELHPND